MSEFPDGVKRPPLPPLTEADRAELMEFIAARQRDDELAVLCLETIQPRPVIAGNRASRRRALSDRSKA